MCVLPLFLHIFAGFLASGLIAVRYEGSPVYRIVPRSDGHVQTLELWRLQHLQLDFWTEPRSVYSNVDVRVNSNDIDWFLELLLTEGLDHEVMIDDVQSLADRQMEQVRDHNASRYYSLAEINEYMVDMTEECTSADESNDCQVITIGQSYEGRDLNIIKIGRQTGDGNQTSVWIDCGIHAREWISPATCQYIVARLIEENDDDSKALRDLYAWYIHPSVNVDGYDYTWTTDRMWRKTRKPNPGSDCVGVDGNRNFDIGWGGTGSSDDPCSETYRGPEPFSEGEVQALDDFLTPIGSQFALALTIHSYGQFFVYPWGYTIDEDPENIEELADVAQVGEDAINAVHQTGYVGRRSNGDMAGNTIDWAKQKAGVPYAYLLELRDDGEYGFLLPPEFIEPTAEEIWAGVQAMAFRIAELEGDKMLE